jgi:putative ABC transport system permease protein
MGTPFSLLLRIALRDLRGALPQFRVFLFCVLFGVAAIAAVGLIIRAAQEGIERDARSLLGGDLLIRTLYQPLPEDVRAYIDAHARTTEHLQMRTMASANRETASEFPPRTLIELKAVEESYPLVGALAFEPPLPRSDIFGVREGRAGAAVEQDLLDTLGLKIGDTLTINDATFDIRALITNEPDRLNASYSIGPRVMIARETLASTGLVQFGSLIYYRVAVAMPEGVSAGLFEQDIMQRFDDGSWEINNLTNAAPGLRRAIDRMGLFLGFAAIATLLIGGVGMANAVNGYLQQRLVTIARFKCLGAGRNGIFFIYLTQIILMALLAVLLGIGLGIGLEYAILTAFADKLPVGAVAGVYARPLLVAAAFGMVSALAFSLPVLLRATRISAALLLRDALAHAATRRSLGEVLILLSGAGALLGLTIWFTGNVKLSLYFAACMLGAMLFFLVLAWGVQALAKWLSMPTRGLKPHVRLAMAGLQRPGSITRSVLLSLGLGVSLMVALALVALNFHRQLNYDRAQDMPAFFLIDILPQYQAPMIADMKAIPGVSEIEVMPMLRGRIVKINGKAIDVESIDPSYRWVVENERGLTYANKVPRGNTITEGTWWPTDHQGKALVSLAQDVGKAIGVKVGDTVTFGALGREIVAEVANFREVNWSSLQMNFSIVLSPEAFGDLPANYLATVMAEDASHGAVLRMLAEKYPSVTVVRLKDTLRQVAELFDAVSLVILTVAALTILIGLFVIGAALNATLQTRMYESVILKVLGQTRRDVLAMLRRELTLLTAITALLALVIGGIIARVIGGLMMLPRFELAWEVPAFALALAFPAAWLLVGVASGKLTSARPLAFLRNE